MPAVLRSDPFSPVLLSSRALELSVEQRLYIDKILDKACSDSRLADKARIAILKVLTAGATVPPLIAGLTPSSAVIGSPDVLLHVIGTGFKNTSKIVFNGGEEVTTFVSSTELTTTINMATAITPGAFPVNVLNEDGVMSSPVNFTFTT